MAEFYTLETRDGIALLTLTREKALNALNEAVLSELRVAIESLRADATVRALIVRGAGEKAFVAGADIAELQRYTGAQSRRFIALGQEVMNGIAALPVPTVASVQGYCLGGGMELALACDFIVAGPKAKFGQPEVSLGVIPGFGGTQRLSRRVGESRAKDMIFSGRMVSADEAAHWGLVNRLVPEGAELVQAAQDFLAPILAQGPVAVRLAKDAIQRGLDLPLAQGLDVEQEFFAQARASADAAEGLAAFLAKRKPVFSGR